MIRLIFQIFRLPAHIIDGIFHVMREFIKIAGSWWGFVVAILWYTGAQEIGFCLHETYQKIDGLCVLYDNDAIWFIWGFFHIWRRTLPDIPRPAWWKLPQRKLKAPKPQKEITATIPIKSHAETKQTRQAMTARLHPDLQAYLANPTKP
jgi:hypothetical protein